MYIQHSFHPAFIMQVRVIDLAPGKKTAVEYTLCSHSFTFCVGEKILITTVLVLHVNFPMRLPTNVNKKCKLIKGPTGIQSFVFFAATCRKHNTTVRVRRGLCSRILEPSSRFRILMPTFLLWENWILGNIFYLSNLTKRLETAFKRQDSCKLSQFSLQHGYRKKTNNLYTGFPWGKFVAMFKW